MRANEDFRGLFFRRELAELRGRGFRVTRLLSLLVALTFCALGFAIGGLQQLRERMENPFTRWVDFTVDSKAEARFGEMTQFLNQPETKAAYRLDGYSNWNRYWLFVHDRRHDPLRQPVDTLTRWQKGRTIDFGDELFTEILQAQGGNLVVRHEEYFDADGQPLNYCGIVVTTTLLDKIGYAPDEYAAVRSLSINVNAGRDLTFLPVMAVVHRLPSKSEFLTSHHLDNILQGSGVYDRFLLRRSTDTTRLRLLGAAASDAGPAIRAAFGEAGENVLVQTSALRVEGGRGYRAYVAILPEEITRRVRDSVARVLAVDHGLVDRAEIDCSDDADRIQRSMYRTFNFAALDEIRGFEEAIEERFGIKMPMEQIENRENFRLVARLTATLGGALFVFGLTALLLYLNNLIQSHVGRIRPHLGTFKAMGLQDRALLSTYTGAGIRLVGESLLLGLPLAYLLGFAIDRWVLRVGFELLHPFILLAAVIMVATLALLTRWQLRRVFKHSPGDLIYERHTATT